MTSTQLAQILGVGNSTVTPVAKLLGVKKVRNRYTVRFDFEKEDALKVAEFLDKKSKIKNKVILVNKYYSNCEQCDDIQQEDKNQSDFFRKMSIVSWFPPIDSYEFLTECNTVRAKE